MDRRRNEEIERVEQPADFETAVSATGYGVFNVLLLLATIPAGWTTAIDTSTVTFIMPSAECDLDLNLFRKGVLAAITYAGMICTALVSCLIADYVGRKYLLIITLMLDALCNIFRSASPNYYVFLGFKFISGIVVGGTFAILMTYIAEFHSERHRTEVLMYTGSLFALGNIAVPALAKVVLPLPWTFSLFDNSFVFSSWRIFLLLCSLPSILGLLTMTILPKSPRFLMTKGKYDEALTIFRKMYSMNTGNSEDTYPIKDLLHEEEETPETPLDPRSRSTRSRFAASYLYPVFVVNAILFATMMGMHMLRSWRTQLMVILNNLNPRKWDTSMTAPTICEKLDFKVIESFRIQSVMASRNATDTCVPMTIAPSIYTNAIITTTSAVVSCFVVGIIVNKVGKKNILLLSLIAAASCNFAIDWAPSSKVFLILASVSVAMTGIATNTITAMIIEVVPTAHRATAVSLTMVTGRLGAATGNLLFPVLLHESCNAPFYCIGGFITLGFVLALFLSKHSGRLQ